jgi:hypothetical protein
VEVAAAQAGSRQVFARASGVTPPPHPLVELVELAAMAAAAVAAAEEARRVASVTSPLAALAAPAALVTPAFIAGKELAMLRVTAFGGAY